VATALVCTDSYCLFNLCISGSVTRRIGRFSTSDPLAGGDGIGKWEAVGIVWRCERREDVIVDVVFVSVCRAFGAGFERFLLALIYDKCKISSPGG
jgi:hypothetical protein